MRNILHSEATNDEPLSAKVITDVAAAKGVSPTEMEPLYSTIDLEAVEALFEDRQGGARTGHVSFRYSGCDITVGSSGQVDVQAPDTENDDSE